MKKTLEKLVEISRQIYAKTEEKSVLSFYEKKKETAPVYYLNMKNK
jgi:hypothetical protein